MCVVGCIRVLHIRVLYMYIFREADEGERFIDKELADKSKCAE